MYQISILRRLLVSICWRKSRFVRAFQPPAPIWIQHPGIQTKDPLEVTYKDKNNTVHTSRCKPQTPFEVTYKHQNNTVHTSGANQKPPSNVPTKIRTTQCTHQYIACRSHLPLNTTATTTTTTTPYLKMQACTMEPCVFLQMGSRMKLFI